VFSRRLCLGRGRHRSERAPVTALAPISVSVFDAFAVGALRGYAFKALIGFN
jgi:hypothetical protein